MYKWRDQKIIHNEKLRKKNQNLSITAFVLNETIKRAEEKEEYVGDFVADILIKHLNIPIPENK
ncbi:hypothetical protein KUA55_17145 [Enterococcus sp. ALS3]|uniref:Uncharacterized protein n=1 Tax=Enterococcus alishanensis TaxID=1303817 RepID=A0ABS6THG7_9ENTE|nr:hypothetical protein [Enterococcus alishanensis]MBV7392388.1 hypothetical protein [Enterococcus alishanensis]